MTGGVPIGWTPPSPAAPGQEDAAMTGGVPNGRSPTWQELYFPRRWYHWRRSEWSIPYRPLCVTGGARIGGHRHDGRFLRLTPG